MRNSKATLFEQIGGKPALDAAINLFYEKVIKDKSISQFFIGVNIKEQSTKLKLFLAMAMGAPVKYTGNDMASAHARLVDRGLNDKHFNTFLQHFADSFKELEIEEQLIIRLIEIAESTRDNVLNKPKNNYTMAPLGNNMRNDKKESTATLMQPKIINQEHVAKVDDIELNNIIQRKEALEQVLEQALDAIVSIDSNKQITFVNGSAEKMFGYTREELIGQNVKVIVPMEHRANHDNYVDNNIRSGVNKVVGMSRELETTRRNGEKFWISLSLSKVLIDGLTNYTAFIKDISADVENKRQANSIKQAVDTAWACIEFMPDGTVLAANENFLKTLGYNHVNEIKHQHHRMFCDHNYVRSNEYSTFWTNLGNGLVNTGEFKRITKQGNEVWINASYTPVKDENGKVIKVIKIANDISEMVENRNQANQLIGEVNVLADKVVSQGDLDARISNTKLNGTYKALGETLNSLMESISTPIKNVSRLSNLVASSAEELLTKGEQMKNTTQEVASATQQMSEGAQQQAQQTDESSKLVDNVLKSAIDMGKKAEIINNAAERGQKSANEGLATIKKVVENMSEILASASSTSNSINVLTQRSEEIARTLNVITDIASQTNLLALNAAIEAARAGDAGRGFAVVAEEIRKLAEDSRKSAVDIEKVIREVQKDINSAGKSIETMESNVKTGNQGSKEAENVFVNIEKSSSETLTLSKEIVNATTLQKESISNTVKNIEKIVVVSEETASGTEQIASSAKELSQGMSEVTSTSRDLADIANQLLNGISKFKFKHN